MNASKLAQFLLIPLWVGFIAFALWLGFTRGNYLVLGLVLILPPAIFFLNKPEAHLMICLMLFNSGLRVPGIWYDVNVFQLAALAYIGITVLRFAITKQGVNLSGPVPLLLILFTLNLLVVIAFRGAGLRFLGDENWGGMRYITVLMMILFFFTIRSVRLTEKQWTITLFGFFLISILPFFAEMVFIFSNGAVYQHYYLFEFASQSVNNLELFMSDSNGLFRLQSGVRGGEALIYLGLAMYVIFPRKRLWVIPLVLLGLGLIGFSGHRIGVLRSGMVSGLFFLLNNPHNRRKILCLYTVAIVLFFVMAYLFAPYLPLAFQRTLAFLPGIQIDAFAEYSATSTVDWRLQVWQYGITEIPEYFLLGKGYTYPANIDTFIALQRASGIWNMETWALETVSYHNGTLSLLVGMGAPGLFLGLMVMLAACFRYYPLTQAEWPSRSIKTLYTMIYSLLVTNVLFFYIIYGDFHISIPPLLFYMTFLEGLSSFSRTADAGTEEEPDTDLLPQSLSVRSLPVA